MLSKKLALIPAVAALLSLGRWLWQGTGTVWSRSSQSFYLPDPDLGWRRGSEGYVWLGLDIVLLFGALALALVVLAHLLRHRGAMPQRWQRVAGALLFASWLVPAAAALQGVPGEGARLTMPHADAAPPLATIEASVEGLPSGRYEIVPHRDSAVAATLVAGGEAFDARFRGQLSGFWQGDPGDLAAPMESRITVRADSVSTGISLRDEHAREELQTDRYPRLEFELGRIIGSDAGEGPWIRAKARGLLHFGSGQHEVDVDMELRSVDAPLRQRLELEEGEHLLVRARLSLRLSDSFIHNDGTFDEDKVPIAITLILKHTQREST